MAQHWVALLRGVNVGGITIRNADLVALFQDTLGFDDVRTCLASGNVRFETDAAAGRRERSRPPSKPALRERFGYDAWIVLVTLDRAAPRDRGVPVRRVRRRAAAVGDLLRRRGHPRRTRGGRGIPRPRPSTRRPRDPASCTGIPSKGSTTDTPFAKILAKATYKSRTTNRNLRTLAKIAS